MKSFYRPVREIPTTTIYAHGFCCWMDIHINVIKHHEDAYNNYDVLFEEPEIEKIFNIKPPQFDSKDYTNDIGQEYYISMLNSTIDNYSNAHTICDDSRLPKLKQKNRIFNEFFSLKNPSLYLEEKNKYLSDKTLGIHIRGTDTDAMGGYNNEENICKHIEYMLDNYEIDNIFLATDDIRYQNLIVKKYGEIVKYKSDKTISHDGEIYIYVDDRSKLNQEVMLDVYLLSNCKYLLYSFSNVSYLALTMGIENFSKILCFAEEIN